MMLRYVYGHDDVVADFVAQLVPSCRERGFGRCRALGVINDNGHLLAGIVYHNYDPGAGVIEMSGAAITPHWLTRTTLEHMYGYPFLGMGVQMTVMRVPVENDRLLRQLASYGYTFIRVPRMLGRDRDGVLALLTYEDWLANKFNRNLAHAIRERGNPRPELSGFDEPAEQHAARRDHTRPDERGEPAPGPDTDAADAPDAADGPDATRGADEYCADAAGADAAGSAAGDAVDAAPRSGPKRTRKRPNKRARKRTRRRRTDDPAATATSSVLTEDRNVEA